MNGITRPPTFFDVGEFRKKILILPVVLSCVQDYDRRRDRFLDFNDRFLDFSDRFLDFSEGFDARCIPLREPFALEKERAMVSRL